LNPDEVVTDNLAASVRKLTRQRDRAQRYLDTAEVILVALDLEGRITLVNRCACRILGWPADELIGREFIEVCVPERLRALTKEKLGIVHAGDDSVIENSS
jgi:PAS domain S-box-containing protein